MVECLSWLRMRYRVKGEAEAADKGRDGILRTSLVMIRHSLRKQEIWEKGNLGRFLGKNYSQTKVSHRLFPLQVSSLLILFMSLVSANPTWFSRPLALSSQLTTTKSFLWSLDQVWSLLWSPHQTEVYFILFTTSFRDRHCPFYCHYPVSSRIEELVFYQLVYHLS